MVSDLHQLEQLKDAPRSLVSKQLDHSWTKQIEPLGSPDCHLAKCRPGRNPVVKGALRMLACGIVPSQDCPQTSEGSCDEVGMTKTDEAGRLPIHYAAMADNVQEIEARLAEGDDINLGDKRGFTPLHMATQHGSRAAARFLLDHGADVDRPNASGNTPLFVAVFNSRGNGELISSPSREGSRSTSREQHRPDTGGARPAHRKLRCGPVFFRSPGVTPVHRKVGRPVGIPRRETLADARARCFSVP